MMHLASRVNKRLDSARQRRCEVMSVALRGCAYASACRRCADRAAIRSSVCLREPQTADVFGNTDFY